MLSWSSRYLKHIPVLAVCTDWPDLITDSRGIWNIQFIDSIHSRLQNMGGNNQLNRYVARVHDRKIDAKFTHCLYVQQPVPIDVSDLIPWLDLEHTTYFDIHNRFIFYRRNQIWKDRVIDFTAKPKTGIIFIDCWQVLEKHQWVPTGFDFYANMIEKLESYNVIDSVFCVDLNDGLALSDQLVAWKQGRSFCSVQHLQDFAARYQSKNLKNWIVVGAHWQQCIHNNPLGFCSLIELKKKDTELKIFSMPECTAKFVSNTMDHTLDTVCVELDYGSDALNWQSRENLYELCL